MRYNDTTNNIDKTISQTIQMKAEEQEVVTYNYYSIPSVKPVNPDLYYTPGEYVCHYKINYLDNPEYFLNNTSPYTLNKVELARFNITDQVNVVGGFARGFTLTVTALQDGINDQYKIFGELIKGGSTDVSLWWNTRNNILSMPFIIYLNKSGQANDTSYQLGSTFEITNFRGYPSVYFKEYKSENTVGDYMKFGFGTQSPNITSTGTLLKDFADEDFTDKLISGENILEAAIGVNMSSGDDSCLYSLLTEGLLNMEIDYEYELFCHS